MTDRDYADRIHAYIEGVGGDSIATNLVKAVRVADLRLSLGCAVIEHESGFRNVFGHDRTIFAGAGRVTKAKYLEYRRQRGHTRMQGVGPAQLTWWEFQDRADELGGCWLPYYNMLEGFTDLADLIAHHGEHDGIRRYNGSGPGAEQYARDVLHLAWLWHRRLTAR